MIPEYGLFALILAFLFALIPLSQWYKPAKFANNHFVYWLTGQAIFCGFAIACLAISFYNNDFSVRYVAEHSHSQLPWWYRLAAVWGGHEGSILLWSCLLAGLGLLAWFSLAPLPQQFRREVSTVIALVNASLLVFLITLSSPFQRLLPLVPKEGLDLNPLLQDPSLLMHPPLLYLGYIGFTVPFALSVVALWRAEIPQNFYQCLRPWVLYSWTLLTIGITLGSLWAYRELGWGGWWFWDPVENASLMPWLSATALLHCMSVAKKRQIMIGATLGLAIICFALSLLGTFLVRSGIVTSVHAFASSPDRGLFLLALIALFAGTSLFLFLFQIDKIRAKAADFTLFSKESALFANAIFLVAALATVLLGTLYPLLMQSLGFAKLSVGAPYFNRAVGYLLLPMLLLLCFGPQLSWQQTTLASVFQRHKQALVLSSFLTVLLLSYFSLWDKPIICLAVFASLTVMFSTLGSLWPLASDTNVNYRAMHLAHFGVAVCVFGMVMSSALSLEQQVKLAVGEQQKIGPYAVQFDRIDSADEGNYRAVRAYFSIYRDGNKQSTVKAEKRIYHAGRTVTTEAGIDANLWRDVYLALGSLLPDDAWSLRIYYKPFVRWIWLGGAFLVIAGLVALLRRKKQ